MTGKQESVFNMDLTTKNELTQNATITGTLPAAYTGLFTSFSANLTQIQMIDELQQTNKSGITDNKDLLREDLWDKGLDGSRKIGAFAKITGNMVLEKEIRFTDSEFKRSTDVGLKNMCQLIYDRGNSNLAGLASYGIIPAWLTAFKASIDAFNAAIPNPRLGIIERKQQTEQLGILFKSNDGILKKIDALVEVVRLSQPQFYSAYKSSRIVIEHGRSLTVKGAVSESGTNVAVPGAKVSFELNGVVKLVKKTAVGGGFSIKSMMEGAYIVTVTKLGYVTNTLPMNIVKGEMANIYVSLVKE